MSASRWSAAAISIAISLLPAHAGAQDIVEAAKAGRLDRVEAVLASDPGAIDTPDPLGYTALR